MIKTSGNGQVEVGRNCRIGKDVQIIFSKPGRVQIGDYVTLGDGVKFVVSGGTVDIGDWTSIHDHGLVLSQTGVTIGQHCWFGQNCVIDGTGGIQIRSGVRVGMYSQLWSHAAAGERIEGCTLYAERQVQIDEDVWLVGSCIVASGVTLGRRLVALIGSNITKSFPANVVIAGTPAAVRPNLSFYSPVSIDDKMAMLRGWLKEAQNEFDIDIETPDQSLLIATDPETGDRLVFAKTSEDADKQLESQSAATICCIETKSYRKKYTPLEWKLLKYLSGNKARFLSHDPRRSFKA